MIESADDIAAKLYAVGCDLETAKFAARLLEQQRYVIVRLEHIRTLSAQLQPHELKPAVNEK